MEKMKSDLEYARAALAAQSRFLEVTLSSIPDYVYAFNREGRFAYVNESMLSMFGLTSDEMLGKNLTDLNYPADLAARLNSHINQIFRTGERIEDEVLYTSPSGVSAFLGFIWGPVMAEDGSIEMVVGVSRDTSERRRWEERLRENEERQVFLLKLSDALRPLAKTADIQSGASQLVGQYLRVNRAAYAEVQGDEMIIRGPYVNGVALLPERFPTEAFGQSLGTAYLPGETLVVNDVENDPNFSEYERAHNGGVQNAAFVVVTLVKEGVLVGAFGINNSAPRNWTINEISLIEDVAERTWAAIERAKAEEALRQSEEKFRALFHSMREGYHISELIRDEDGNAIDFRFIELNSAHEKISGLALKDMIGRSAVELYPSTAQYGLKIYDEVVRSEKQVRAEWYIEDSKKWYAVLAFPLGGNKFGVLYDDITVRKLQEQHQTFLSEVSKDLVGLTTALETMEQLGEKIGRYFGVTWCMFSEHIDDSETTAVSYGWNAEDAVSLKGTYKMHDFQSDEQIMAKNAGKLLIVSDTEADPQMKTPSYSAFGFRSFISIPLARKDQWRFMISVIDNKPREWRDDEVELLNEIANRIWIRLERARAKDAQLKQKDEFIGIASHELKTPITSIKTYTEIIMDDLVTSGNTEHATLLQKLNNQVDRLTNLVTDLLDTTKITGGQMMLSLENFTLSHLVTERLEELRRLSGNRHFILDVPEQLMVYADKERIGQVITNLVSNAIKYSPDNSAITIFSSANQDGVSVSVKDEGIGISQKNLDKIFNRFFRTGSSTANNYPGMGLGLYIAAEIVNRHGGNISVQSVEGKGSVFCFVLPIPAINNKSPIA
jgi:PAS domain S-box-containing protein